MGKITYFTIKERLIVDLDTFLSETISIISQVKKDIDLFMLNTDLKQYVLDEANNLSETDNIPINEAVETIITQLGPPERFANTILAEVSQEKNYLIGKVLIASLIAFFPVIVLLIALIP